MQSVSPGGKSNFHIEDMSAHTLFAVRIVGVGLSVGVGLGIARWLGAEASGLYYLFLSITLAGALLSRRGMDTVALKNISIDLDADNLGGANGSWVYCCRKVIKNAAVLLVIVLAAWAVLPPNIIDLPAKAILYAVIATPLQALHMVNIGALRGGGRQGLAAALEVIVVPLVVVVGTFVSSLFSAVDAYTPIIFYVLGVFVSLVIGAATVRSWFKGQATILPDPVAVKHVSSSFFAVGMSAFIIDWSSTFALAAFSPVEDIGIYNVCFRIVALGGLVLSIFNNLHAPQFAIAFRAGRLDAVKEVARGGAQKCFLVGCAALLPVFLFPELLLALLGDEFLRGAPVLRIMILAQLFNMFTGSVGYLLLMSENEKSLRSISYFCLILQLLILVPATAAYGLLGAAFTWSAVGMFRNIVTMYWVKKKTGILVVPTFMLMLRRPGGKC